MIKVRVQREDGWYIARLTIGEYLYGKFWVTVSDKFRRGARIYNIKIIMPWDAKYIKG